MSHVLFISHARGIHGAEAVMVRAAKACAARGVRVTVVLPSIVPDEGMEKALHGVCNLHLMSLPYRAAGKSMLRTQLVRVYNIRTLLNLKRYVINEHVDRIYSGSSVTILGVALSRMTGVCHVWHWHEPVDVRFGWHPSMKAYYRRAAKATDIIVCISQQQKTEWEHTLEVPLTNAQIVYNPIKRLPLQQALPHEGIRFGFIGHFEERKNLSLLIRTFEQLHATHPHTSLWLCGAVGEKDRLYVEQMTALREPSVHVLSQTPDVASFYANIDVLVLPSWRETMPLVVLEAMQAGVCVLQTDQSGMSEIIKDGKESLFFSPYAQDALLRLMERCMDEKEFKNIASAGQKKAIQLVNNQSFDDQITRLLCE